MSTQYSFPRELNPNRQNVLHTPHPDQVQATVYSDGKIVSSVRETTTNQASAIDKAPRVAGQVDLESDFSTQDTYPCQDSKFMFSTVQYEPLEYSLAFSGRQSNCNRFDSHDEALASTAQAVVGMLPASTFFDSSLGAPYNYREKIHRQRGFIDFSNACVDRGIGIKILTYGQAISDDPQRAWGYDLQRSVMSAVGFDYYYVLFYRIPQITDFKFALYLLRQYSDRRPITLNNDILFTSAIETGDKTAAAYVFNYTSYTDLSKWICNVRAIKLPKDFGHVSPIFTINDDRKVQHFLPDYNSVPAQVFINEFVRAGILNVGYGKQMSVSQSGIRKL